MKRFKLIGIISFCLLFISVGYVVFKFRQKASAAAFTNSSLAVSDTTPGGIATYTYTFTLPYTLTTFFDDGGWISQYNDLYDSGKGWHGDFHAKGM